MATSRPRYPPTPMDQIDLLIDLHADNQRQGPGGDDQTRRAIELAGIDPAAPVRVADVGCGTGASAIVLARTLNARVDAIDASPLFISRLRERARRLGLGGRITAQTGQMGSLPFGDGSLDVLWSEAAVYNIGFEAGVRAWRALLRPGGVLAVSELTWTTPDRPEEVHSHWAGEYPAITTATENIRTLERASYRPLAFFFVPPRCWEANYYQPLRTRLAAFLERHGHSPKARAVAAAEEREMRLYSRWGSWYGYAFYIARKQADADGPTPA